MCASEGVAAEGYLRGGGGDDGGLSGLHGGLSLHVHLQLYDRDIYNMCARGRTAVFAG